MKKRPKCPNLAKRFNAIDEIITKLQLKAEKKVKKRPFKYPWSPLLIFTHRKVQFLRQIIIRTPFNISEQQQAKCTEFRIKLPTTLENIKKLFTQSNYN